MIKIDIDPRVVETPEDSGRVMLLRIYEAKIKQAREEGYLRGRSDGYEEGFADGRKIEREDFSTHFAEYMRART